MQDTSQRLPHLDGIRALAALWVVLGHSHLYALGWTSGSTPLGKALDVLLYLHLAVDVFLVLSGFCLALPVVRNGYRLNVPVGDYLWGRAARILPPYYAVLLLLLLVNSIVPITVWSRHAAGLTQDLPAGVLWSNLLLLQDIFPTYNQINGPFWSIATEWHLYFLFPLIVVLLRRIGEASLMVLGAALAALLVRADATLGIASPAFPIMVPHPPHYILLFLLGIASASLAFGGHGGASKARPAVAWATMALLGIPLLLLLYRWRIVDASNVHVFEDHYPILDALTGGVTAAGLWGLAQLPAQAWARRVLAWRPLVWIGGFSYSLYLVHNPVLAAVYRWIQLSKAGTLAPSLQFALLVAAGGGASLLLAWGIGRVFEVRVTRALSPKRWRAARVQTGSAAIT